MTRLACLLLLIAPLLALTTAPARAQPFPVDDSASQVIETGPLRMRWDQIAPGHGHSNAITGHVVVLVRLDVSPWQGQRGRIFMRLAPVPSGPVSAEWTSNGPLLPGRLRDGERQLVFAGAIADARLEDRFRITIQADGTRVTRTENLDFSFEFEPESP